MYRRRMSCPQVVQQLWDAVKVIRYQRQVPNLERIVKYMNRVHSVNEGKYLHFMHFLNIFLVNRDLATFRRRKKRNLNLFIYLKF